MCVPYTGTEAWTRSVGYKVVDEWRPWISNGQVAGYVTALRVSSLISKTCHGIDANVDREFKI